MKKIIYIIFYVLFGVTVYSQSYEFKNQTYIYQIYYTDWNNPGFQFSFLEDCFAMDIPEMDENLIEEGQYIHERIKSPYNISNENDFLYLNIENRKFLILYYENLLCTLVDCDDYTTYFGVNEKSKYVNIPSNPLRLKDWWIGIFDPEHYDTRFSSCLKENEIVYDNNNKFSWQLKYPWVEGKSGSGIDEWIEKKAFKKTKKIVLLNGYVDPKHPDYFYKNERIKDVEVYVANQKYDYTLEDSSQIQILELPEYIDGVVRLKIKSVYSGTKYTDTCLSYFLFLSEKNIKSK